MYLDDFEKSSAYVLKLFSNETFKKILIVNFLNKVCVNMTS